MAKPTEQLLITPPPTKRLCLYCGEPTKKGKRGEHIIPEVIGGAKTLNDVSDRVVCVKCNNGILSQLDRELCCRSLLSIVASQQIDAHLWQAWDVDHSANHLLVEARPSWADDGVMNHLVCYPQITFEGSGPQVRGDAIEFERFGQADSTKVLFKAVRQNFDRWCKTGKGLNFERIQSGVIQDGYRLAPRVFIRHTISEIARNINRQSIILRYASEEEKRFALYSLSKIGDGPKLNSWSQKPGSYWPTVSCFFDIAETLRALMKLGLNLIAAFCKKTPVNHESFAEALRIIRGEMQMLPPAFKKNGFTHAADIQCIKGGDREHSFRLQYLNRIWYVYSSFFGGRIGAFVRLPGPNHEDWNCADIIVPIGSKDWTFKPSPILQAMKVRLGWNGMDALAPSVKLQRSLSSILLEVQRRK